MPEKEIIPFNFNEWQIRVIRKDDGSLWFVAKDICDAQGVKNPSDAVSRLKDYQKDDIDLTDTVGKRQNYIIVDEAGMYELTASGRKASADQFRKWLFKRVIPSIRKTGSYSIKHKIPQTYSAALRVAADEHERAERLEAEKAILEPKALVYDRVSDSTGLTNIRDSAKVLGMSPLDLVFKLVEMEMFFRSRGKLIPYQPHIDKGWFEVKLVPARDKSKSTYRQSFVTPLGINKLRELFNPTQPTDRLFS